MINFVRVLQYYLQARSHRCIFSSLVLSWRYQISPYLRSSNKSGVMKPSIQCLVFLSHASRIDHLCKWFNQKLKSVVATIQRIPVRRARLAPSNWAYSSSVSKSHMLIILFTCEHHTKRFGRDSSSMKKFIIHH